jgi:hypothetical protein
MKKKKQIRKVMNRKIARNIIRKQVGNKGLAEAWKRNSIKHMGFLNWLRMRLANVPKNQRTNLYYDLKNG